MTITEFSSLELNKNLLRAVTELGYAKPTPIQAASIPPALQGRDVLGAAQTGSGKTAAFLLPVLQRLLGRPRGATRALVVAPTRELAAQIEESARALAKYTDVRVASVFGGVGMRPQEQALRSGTELVIATPGRLLDHMQHPYARFDRVEVLVLDEADRMLDMGFLPDIRRVLRQLPTDRQTLFFSATMPGEILNLSRELTRDPVRVGVERKAAPAQGITQEIFPVSEELKTDLLVKLLDTRVTSAIVFTRTKHRANRLAERLLKAGVPAERIHGNRSQSARTEALAGFKSGKYRVLVATDIAARGIDVEALGHVINFDVPAVAEDYIHRVGRTARAEMTGEALTFVSPAEESDLKAIERAVGSKLSRVTVPNFDYGARPAERFEVPIQERIAEIRARKADERARARAKAERKALLATQDAPAGQSSEPRGGGARGESAGRDQAGPRPQHAQGAQVSAASGSRRRRGGRGGRSRGGTGRSTE